MYMIQYCAQIPFLVFLQKLYNVLVIAYSVGLFFNPLPYIESREPFNLFGYYCIMGSQIGLWILWNIFWQHLNFHSSSLVYQVCCVIHLFLPLFLCPRTVRYRCHLSLSTSNLRHKQFVLFLIAASLILKVSIIRLWSLPISVTRFTLTSSSDDHDLLSIIMWSI